MERATIPAATILPLRLFLGLTFLYAAIQKMADPGFLRAGSSTYIGTQTHGFAQNSPIGSLLRSILEPHPVLTGFGIIATEWAVGVLVLLGLFARFGALVGLMTNLGLFLSASWNIYPYFLGSDIVFVVAWGTLLLSGPGPYALDSFFSRSAQPPGMGTWSLGSSGTARLLSRHDTLLGGVAVLTLVLLGLLPRTRGGASSGVAPLSTPGPGRPGTASPGGIIPPGAKKVGTVAQIPVNSAAALIDPKTGNPAVIVHVADRKFVAFDATCTHAGCTVAYDPASRLLACPCHGAEYDPTRSATVVAGPAPSPLTALQLVVDAKGDIYLV